MPGFNDYNQYSHPYSSSHHSYPSFSSYNTRTGFQSPSSYTPSVLSNYQPQNLVSTVTSAGIKGHYYGGAATNKSPNYYNNYKTTSRSGAKYNEKYADKNTFTPSQYTTYSLWKENQMASKWRNENYRWNNHIMKTALTPSKPVVIDTSKIDVTTPRYKRRTPSPEPVKERTTQNDNHSNVLGRNEQYGTIKRGRTVVRMHTKVLKENPYVNKKLQEKNPEPKEPEPVIESKINRMSPVRFSRLKKKSVLYNFRHDSDEKKWLDSDSSSDSDGDDVLKRENTIKKANISRSGTIKRDDTLKHREEGTVKRHYLKTSSKELSVCVDEVHNKEATVDVARTDRRLSMELYEEQAALLDSMIKEELARKDADDYFSDPKRGTVKIRGKDRESRSKKTGSRSSSHSRGHSTDSNTDEDDSANSSAKGSKDNESPSEKSTPSSSRRNSLFQDLIIGETISETFIEDLENKIQNNYSNPEKVLPESKKNNVNVEKKTSKVLKKPSRIEPMRSPSGAQIDAIAEVEENRPKTPKGNTNEIKQATKFTFANVQVNAKSEKDQSLEIVGKEKNKDVSPKALNLSPELSSNTGGNNSRQGVVNSSVAPPGQLPPTETLKKLPFGKEKDLQTHKQQSEKPISQARLSEMPKVNQLTTTNKLIGIKDKNVALQNKITDKSSQKSTIPVTVDKNKSEDTFSFPTEESDIDRPKSVLMENLKAVPAIDQSKTSQNRLNIPSNECEKTQPTGKLEIIAETQTQPQPVECKISLTTNSEKLESCLKKELTPNEKSQPSSLVKKTGNNKEAGKEDDVQTPMKDHEPPLLKENDTSSSVNSEALQSDSKKVMNQKSQTSSPVDKTGNQKGQVQKHHDLPEISDKCNVIKKEDNKETTCNSSDMNKDLSSESNKATASPSTMLPLLSETKSQKVINSSEKKDKESKDINSSEKVSSVSSSQTSKDKSITGKKEKNVAKVSKSPVEKKAKIINTQKISSPPKSSPETKPKKKAVAETQEAKGEVMKPLQKVEVKKLKTVKKIKSDSKEMKGKTQKKAEETVVKKQSTIVHMKPRAMTLRTVVQPLPSVKTPKLAPLPQPLRAEIKVITPREEEEKKDEVEEEEESSDEDTESCDDSTETEGSDTDTNEGNQRNSISSLDSGFGSACYKSKKGICASS